MGRALGRGRNQGSLTYVVAASYEPMILIHHTCMIHIYISLLSPSISCNLCCWPLSLSLCLSSARNLLFKQQRWSETSKERNPTVVTVLSIGFMGGSSNTSGNDIPFLPEDVLISILVLLPVVSLLRFKSVCKSWLFLIERPDFVQLHGTTLENDKSSKLGTFIFQSRLESHRTNWKFRPHFFVVSGADDFEAVEDLGVPPYFNNELERRRRVSMVSSCDGIVCIHDSRRRDVALWNPTTKQFRLLPKVLNFTVPRRPVKEFPVRDFVGFGFDIRNKDYKVLLVRELNPEFSALASECMRQAQVYSLSSDSWRYIDIDLPFRCSDISPHNQGRYLNGSYFLKGYFHEQDPDNSEWEKLTSMILSFNFGGEEFRLINYPDEVEADGVFQLNIYCDKLSFLEDVGKNVYEDSSIVWYLWVLNDDYHRGKKESASWTKLLKVELLPYLYTMYGPLAFSKNGEFGFPMRDVLQRYNVVTQETKDCTQWKENVKALKADIFKRSLVSISGKRTFSSGSSSGSSQVS